MEYHEVANIFPLLVGDEYKAFKTDIELNGLLEPIWIHDNKIIDGRNRYRACDELGIEPKFRQWNEIGSLVAFVVSLNLHRRHLEVGQKAAVAVEALPPLEAEAKERQTRKSRTDLAANLQQQTGRAGEKAGELFGVSERYVNEAKHIKQESPEIFEQLKAGELNIPKAKKALRIKQDQKKSFDYALTQDDLNPNYMRLAMAIIKQAIMDAAEYPYNEEPTEWLLGDECLMYCSNLKIPHQSITAWIDAGCPTMPIHKRIISTLEESVDYG